MDVPTTSIIVIYSPYTLLFCNQCKYHSISSLVGIKTQINIFSHVCTSANDWTLCL